MNISTLASSKRSANECKNLMVCLSKFVTLMVGMLVWLRNLSFVLIASSEWVLWTLYDNVKNLEPKLPLRLCSPPPQRGWSQKNTTFLLSREKFWSRDRGRDKGWGWQTDGHCLMLVYSSFLADESENVRQSVPSTFLLPFLWLFPRWQWTCILACLKWRPRQKVAGTGWCMYVVWWFGDDFAFSGR